MQEAMQSAIQPYINLMQKNMALLTRFSMSPEVLSQAMANAQAMLQRGPGAATGTASMPSSNAIGELTQEMVKNYTEFMAELGQSGMALLAQSQAAMVQNTQEAVDSATESSSRSRRAR